MTDDFQPPAKGDADYGAHCDVCHQHVAGNSYAVDEDDTTWCLMCMLKWEKEHGCHWENGQPMKEEKK